MQCISCGESMKYVKTVRSRQLRKRWEIFKCTACGKELRKVI
jgi:ribosomal protein L34E